PALLSADQGLVGRSSPSSTSTTMPRMIAMIASAGRNHPPWRSSALPTGEPTRAASAAAARPTIGAPTSDVAANAASVFLMCMTLTPRVNYSFLCHIMSRCKTGFHLQFCTLHRSRHEGRGLSTVLQVEANALFQESGERLNGVGF